MDASGEQSPPAKREKGMADDAEEALSGTTSEPVNRGELLASLFERSDDQERVRQTGGLSSRHYVGEALKLLYERMRENPPDGSDSATRLRRLGLAETEVSADLFATVRHFDEVGVWGGRSLAHCTTTFVYDLWRGPQPVVAALGDTDDHTPLEIGHSTVVENDAGDRRVTVYRDTPSNLKARYNVEWDADAIPHLLPPHEVGCVRLYHATSEASVADIVYNGIDVSRSAPTTDFGKGFYMTPEIGCALHFLLAEAPAYSSAWPRALLAIDVDAEALEGMSELKELRDGTQVWRAVVGEHNVEVDSCLLDLTRPQRQQFLFADVAVGPITTRAPDKDTPWVQYCFKEGAEKVDPRRFMQCSPDSIVRAVNVVRYSA